MKTFLDEDFLLNSRTAVRLYQDFAKDEPIFDFHNHLDPAAILQDKSFTDLFEVWLSTDHYKWKAMRMAGVPEALITGNAPAREKFDAWAKTLPLAAGNPLYHWTHLELKRIFGMDVVFSQKTAERIWEEAAKLLKTKDFTARSLLRRSNVRVVCTTDDPADSLASHKALRSDPSLGFSVRPTFRPDRIFPSADTTAFAAYSKKLGDAAGVKIVDGESLFAALEARLQHFEALGCRASDHALVDGAFLDESREKVEGLLKRALNAESLSVGEVVRVRSALLVELGKRYAERGWVMQLHVGALRNVNTPSFQRLGPDTGYDVAGPAADIPSLAKFLDKLETTCGVPKTVLYNLNPSDNEAFAVLAGAFSRDLPGRVQYGAAWWFNDNKNGNRAQLETVAAHGLLGTFIGMLTDSRSFLSFPRHEYFRRILCELVGGWVEAGELPNDDDLVEQLIRGVCSRNAELFFGFSGGEK